MCYLVHFIFVQRKALLRICQFSVLHNELSPEYNTDCRCGLIKPALKKELVITDTSELDCIIVVETIPNPKLRQRLDVDLRRILPEFHR